MKPRFHLRIDHGERDSVFNILDTQAPEEEWPAVVYGLYGNFHGAKAVCQAMNIVAECGK